MHFHVKGKRKREVKDQMERAEGKEKSLLYCLVLLLTYIIRGDVKDLCWTTLFATQGRCFSQERLMLLQ